MTKTEGPVQRADRVLGRMVLRIWAVVAFVAAAASVGFGAVVLVAAPVPGVILLLLGALFVWLGVRAWRDRATLGDVLSRDYQPGTRSTPPDNRRG